MDLKVSSTSAQVRELFVERHFTSVPLRNSGQYHKLHHALRPSPTCWYCIVIENEVGINRRQEASVLCNNSFHSEPITGHLSAAHAIFHHTVTPGHMGYKQILRIQPSISFQYAMFLCLGCNWCVDADFVQKQSTQFFSLSSKLFFFFF